MNHPNIPNPPPPDAETNVIPVVQEKVVVTRVTEKTGHAARVRVLSEEETQHIPVSDIVDEVTVERIPINRIVPERMPPRAEGDALIVPVYESVAVVEQRLVLKEELRIVRRKREVPREEEVLVLKERAIVERRTTEDGEWRPDDAAP